MTISKGERDELRRVVRQDFKVLISEMGVREAELIAEIEQHIATRFEPADDAVNAANEIIGQAVAEANRKIKDAITEALKSADGYRCEYVPLGVPRMYWVPEKRDEMRRALKADLAARVAGAKLRVQRQEADLLKTLARGALESDEAQAFLANIPTVTELVPSSKLAELEAQFDQPEEDA